MKHIRPEKPGSAGRRFVFEISKREKAALLSALKLYPLLDADYHQLSRDPKTTGAAEQEWLEEAMEQQQREHKKRLAQIFEDEDRFFKEDNGEFRFVLTGEQMEWLLRVLNEVRVGSWVRLGRPSLTGTRRLTLSSSQSRYFAAMELCGYFQSVLLQVFD